MISIIDYGSGNLQNVVNAFNFLGAEAQVVKTPEEVSEATTIVLPGVGSFDAAMKNLEPLKESLLEKLNAGVPYLGICLGYQILFENSEEGVLPGLGFFKGSVIRIPTELKLPQIGWNDVVFKESTLTTSIPTDSQFYFVNSYVPKPEDIELVLGTTTYGTSFTSAISKENLLATQFHPEKSGAPGLQLLKNFLEVTQ